MKSHSEGARRVLLLTLLRGPSYTGGPVVYVGFEAFDNGECFSWHALPNGDMDPALNQGDAAGGKYKERALVALTLPMLLDAIVKKVCYENGWSPTNEVPV